MESVFLPYMKAYDKGYIAITEKFEIIISKELKARRNETYYEQHFSFLENLKMQAPTKYYPNKRFLQFHLDEVFRG
jgi:putative restriction endonuclease